MGKEISLFQTYKQGENAHKLHNVTFKDDLRV